MQQSTMTHTEQLAALVEKKHAYLVQLRDLGVRQRELIEANEMTQLLRILPSKSLLIGALRRMEQELAPYRDEDPDARVWRSAEARARCAEKAAACSALLDAVVRQEKANETLMLQRRKTVADRLSQVHVAARASGAYRVHARGTAGTVPPQSEERHGSGGGDGAAVRAAAPSSGLDLSSNIR